MTNNDWLKQAIDRIEDRQQKTADQVGEIKVLLLPLADRVSKLEAEMRPIKEHVMFMRTTARLGGIAGSVIAVAAGVWRALR